MNNDPVLDATTDPVPPPTRGRVLAMLAMCATAVLVWALELGPAHAARVFVDGWQVALTMVFGSFVAGSTAMGGAVSAICSLLAHGASHHGHAVQQRSG